jgi:hypothetical protein
VPSKNPLKNPRSCFGVLAAHQDYQPHQPYHYSDKRQSPGANPLGFEIRAI